MLVGAPGPATLDLGAEKPVDFRHQPPDHGWVARQIELSWRCTSCGHKNLGRHLACASCGGPKDDSEHYEMPGDSTQIASVADPRLVAMATAGANWRCRYCGSNARAPDGDCAHCGGGRAEGRSLAPVPAVPARQRMAALAPRGGRISMAVVALGVAAVAFLVVTGLVVAAAMRSRPRPPAIAELPAHRDVLARVREASWVHRVYVERWSIVPREGFAEQRPNEAFDVRPLDERVHHVDKVPDGTTTESYTEQVTEQVTETYTAQEPCGQDCTTVAPTCHEECTNNQNGFASCRDVCSGGGQSCTPRTCSVTKTRTVPKTTPVTKTRQVPKLKDVPRMARWFAWRVWDWCPARTVEQRGVGFDARWPTEAELAPPTPLGKEEKERRKELAIYTVKLASDDGASLQLSARTLAEHQGWRDATGVLRVYRHGGTELRAGPTREPGSPPAPPARGAVPAPGL
jgi:hypothetical protein